MTRDDIIRMAREAWGIEFIPKQDVTNLERFAAFIAAHEREACAKACERIEDEAQMSWDMHADPWNAGQERGAYQCAAAIRARGEE